LQNINKKVLFFNSSFLQLIVLSLVVFLALLLVLAYSILVFKASFAFGDIDDDNMDSNTSTTSSSSFPSSSPSFGMQEIENIPHNWIDVWRGISSIKGSNYTDIRSINYFSNGRFLNATLWLDDFNPSPSTDRRVNYGMYIDSDFNNKTGIAGIDYKIEIQWNPASKLWTRDFEQWSTNGHTRTIDIKQNYTGFYQKVGAFVNLYADLKEMVYPQKYRVLFYAEEIKLKGVSWIMNSPKWINIPPPKFVITANPNIIYVKAGEQKIINLQVKSTTGFQPLVQFYSGNSQIPSLIRFDFAYNKLQIPSIGEATTPLTIYTSDDTKRYPYTAIISANFSFPSQEFNTPSTALRKIIIPTENVITESTITVIVQDPPNPIDIINDFWSKAGGFINFLYIAGIAIASWISATYIKHRNKTKYKESNN
jgi:hypothetical protein